MGNLTLWCSLDLEAPQTFKWSLTLSVTFMNELFNQLSEFSCADNVDLSSNLSPQSARLRAAGIGKDFKENPSLRDNWTDAEGYYREFVVL